MGLKRPTSKYILAKKVRTCFKHFCRPATHVPVFRKLNRDLVLLNDGGCFDKIAIDGSNYIGLVAVKAPLNVYYENFKNLIPSFLSVF